MTSVDACRLDNKKRLSHWNGKISDMGQPFLEILDITKSRIVEYFIYGNFTSRLQRLGARVISQPSYEAKCASSLVRLTPVAGLQDVGHAAVATGRGELRLRTA
jgi:hypothetical protein